MSLQIDGDTYQELLENNPKKTSITANTQNTKYLQIHYQLKRAAKKNQLNSPIYLLTKSANKKEFFFGVSSDDKPIFRNSYKRFPKKLYEAYESGGVLPPYDDEHGTWLSAFSPIKNNKGQVVAVVQVDNVYTDFCTTAKEGLFRNILLSAFIVFLIAGILKFYLKKVMELMRDKEKAEHQAVIKAKFLSTMSHEIRTPMNAVIGLTNILLRDEPREDQIENLNTLKFSADVLLALINDILDYSKLEAGAIGFENIPFKLRDLIHNIKKTLGVKSKEKNIDLKVIIDENVPETVLGDPVRISQILTNLIGNAIKFTHEGYVAIKLKVLETDEEHALIHFAIKDTGIGIPKEKFDSIFKSFSQADTNTTRKYGGTGLGLSITKRLLELMGSKIQVSSIEGKGTTFFFDLKIPISQEKTVQKESLSYSNQEIRQFPGVKILLVEDNKINVMVAKKFLQKWGLLVDVAENGQIAVDKIQQTDYKLVLMDLNMPVLDGYGATKAIRKLKGSKYQSLPIIALSASAIANYKNAAIEVGMNGFITKPFKPLELNQHLSRFLTKELDVV
ncbi:MAG TPA: response regulator [Saprospiraceae bacterium]|nr:response regulator [Saprospiraceae bacterium]